MKRLHISLGVKDLKQSIRFYTELFGETPTVTKPEYAKWMLEDPRVNFSISSEYETKGVGHLGIQAETEDELREIYNRIRNSQGEVFEEGHTTCCYAKSEKSWVTDPNGVSWEAFLTTGASQTYRNEETACCA